MKKHLSKESNNDIIVIQKNKNEYNYKESIVSDIKKNRKLGY